MMLKVFISLTAFTSLAAGLQAVRCSEGASCSSASGFTTIGNVRYCCSNGASMSIINNNCLCNTPEPCLEGLANCSGARSWASVNGVLKCCRDGSSIANMVSNINGVGRSICTCGGGGGGIIINGGSGVRAMTPEERAQLNAQMTNMQQQLTHWQSNFQRQMANFQRNLFRNLGLSFK